MCISGAFVKQKSESRSINSRQTRHPIAHLGHDRAKCVGPLTFHFEHLSKVGPHAVVGEQATDGDDALVESFVSFDSPPKVGQPHIQIWYYWEVEDQSALEVVAPHKADAMQVVPHTLPTADMSDATRASRSGYRRQHASKKVAKE